MDVKTFITEFIKWAESQSEILGVLLVGSYARNKARPDSDIDLVIITSNPETYLGNNEWIENFGEIKEVINEDYKMVQAKRAFYGNGLEVEFGITTKEWAKINPIDSGTERVIKDGAKILLDKTGMLKDLIIKS